MTEISRHDYLNPNYMPNLVDEEWFEQHRTSDIACSVWALVSTIESAFGASSSPPSQDGISGSLAVARKLADDLIKYCEHLEYDLIDARKKAEAIGDMVSIPVLSAENIDAVLKQRAQEADTENQ